MLGSLRCAPIAAPIEREKVSVPLTSCAPEAFLFFYFFLTWWRSELLNAQNETGDTALMKASASGFVPTAACLLQHGAQADLPNRYGETPLYHAAHFGHVAAAAELLRYGASPFKMSADGITPLAIATLRAHQPVVAVIGAHIRWVVFRLLMLGRLKQPPRACPLGRLPVSVLRRIHQYAFS